MKYYTIYNPVTGEIVRSGHCDDDGFSFQTEPGCETIEGESNYLSNYVLNKQIQTYTPSQKTLKNQVQPPYMEWSNTSFTYVDTRTTDQLRADQIVAVGAKRDNLLSISDWIVVRATDQGVPIPTDWKTYRQALRDVTTQSGYPFNVIWPIPPTTN